jgi:transposase
MVMERKTGRDVSVEVLNERRRQAVKLRLTGMKLKDIVAPVDLAKSTKLRTVSAYEQGGGTAVGVEKHGRPTGSGRRLLDEQEAQVQAWTRDTTPD